jgi:hypothetical protein
MRSPAHAHVQRRWHGGTSQSGAHPRLINTKRYDQSSQVFTVAFVVLGPGSYTYRRISFFFFAFEPQFDAPPHVMQDDLIMNRRQRYLDPNTYSGCATRAQQGLKSLRQVPPPPPLAKKILTKSTVAAPDPCSSKLSRGNPSAAIQSVTNRPHKWIKRRRAFALVYRRIRRFLNLVF